MSSDVINGLAIDNVTRDHDYDAVLACQDKCIRVVNGSGLAIPEIPVSAPVTCITTISSVSSNGVDGCSSIGEARMKSGATGLVYGLATGGIGFIQVDRGGALGTSWCVEDGSSSDAGLLGNTGDPSNRYSVIL